MASRDDLKLWVYQALTVLGPSTVPEVARYIWENHESELRASGDLFFTWQYAMRWEAQKLQNEGKLQKKTKGRVWVLV